MNSRIPRFIFSIQQKYHLHHKIIKHVCEAIVSYFVVSPKLPCTHVGLPCNANVKRIIFDSAEAAVSFSTVLVYCNDQIESDSPVLFQN